MFPTTVTFATAEITWYIVNNFLSIDLAHCHYFLLYIFHLHILYIIYVQVKCTEIEMVSIHSIVLKCNIVILYAVMFVFNID